MAILVRRRVSLLARAVGAPLAGLGLVASWVAGNLMALAGWTGSYPSTDRRRKVLEDWRPRPATANQALAPSLEVLVAQGRHLDRSTPAGRAMVEGRKAELVGTGIDVEPDTGDKRIDAILKKEWRTQKQHIGACCESLWTLQRMASGDIDTAGAALWRACVIPDRVDDGLIPLCIVPLEVEWLSPMPVAPLDANNRFLLGVEFDGFGRPQAYHLRNPEVHGMGFGERVAARDISHVYERRRALQALGEPRMAPLVERVLQDDELVIAELKGARSVSGMSVLVNSDELSAPTTGTDGTTAADDPVTSIDLGAITYLGRADKITPISHNRPSQSVRDFRGTIRGDVAAGAQVSRVWLDRDGSAYNFANSKFDQIRTQMMVRPAHDWFGEGVASWAYRQAVPWMLMKNGVAWPKDPVKARALLNHRLQPDVPPELDEKTANEAFSSGFAAGVTSRADFLSSRGKDPAEVAAQIDSEQRDDAARAVARVAEIQRACNAVNAAVPGLDLKWSQVVAIAGAATAPGAFLQATAPKPGADAGADPNAAAAADPAPGAGDA